MRSALQSQVGRDAALTRKLSGDSAARRPYHSKAGDASNGRSYGFAEGAGETAGCALPVGKTPAPESAAGETPGEV